MKAQDVVQVLLGDSLEDEIRQAAHDPRSHDPHPVRDLSFAEIRALVRTVLPGYRAYSSYRRKDGGFHVAFVPVKGRRVIESEVRQMYDALAAFVAERRLKGVKLQVFGWVNKPGQQYNPKFDRLEVMVDRAEQGHENDPAVVYGYGGLPDEEAQAPYVF